MAMYGLICDSSQLSKARTPPGSEQLQISLLDSCPLGRKTCWNMLRCEIHWNTLKYQLLQVAILWPESIAYRGQMPASRQFLASDLMLVKLRWYVEWISILLLSKAYFIEILYSFKICRSPRASQPSCLDWYSPHHQSFPRQKLPQTFLEMLQ